MYWYIAAGGNRLSLENKHYTRQQSFTEYHLYNSHKATGSMPLTSTSDGLNVTKTSPSGSPAAAAPGGDVRALRLGRQHEHDPGVNCDLR